MTAKVGIVLKIAIAQEIGGDFELFRTTVILIHQVVLASSDVFLESIADFPDDQTGGRRHGPEKPLWHQELADLDFDGGVRIDVHKFSQFGDGDLRSR